MSEQWVIIAGQAAFTVVWGVLSYLAHQRIARQDDALREERRLREKLGERIEEKIDHEIALLWDTVKQNERDGHDRYLSRRDFESAVAEIKDQNRENSKLIQESNEKLARIEERLNGKGA